MFLQDSSCELQVSKTLCDWKMIQIDASRNEIRKRYTCTLMNFI